MRRPHFALFALPLFFSLLNVIYAQECPGDSISLKYGGQSVDMSAFGEKFDEDKSSEAFDRWQKVYTAPDGKLQITVNGRNYKKFPVTEYAVSLTNLSKTEETETISDFQTLDLTLPIPSDADKITLNTLRGSNCIAEDFSPIAVGLAAGESREFSTPSGRSSNEYMPFVDLGFGDVSGRLFAIGWTGSWAARFANDSKNVNVKIGMDHTHFKLLPAETVIQPSVTVFTREGQTRREFQTLVHRFMLENKVPRDSQGKIIPPILAIACGGGNKTPQMMLDILKYVVDNEFPFDTYWIDAGWYGAPHEDELYSNCGPNWYKYVGDWRVNTTTHPSGTLLPIAEAVHKNGMKLLLWFEPERIFEETPVYTEHPEFRNGALLDLGNPEARRWIKDIVYEMIAKHGINIYRQDFNIDPGPIWESVDKENPDRVGIAEAKHIAGLYEMMDEMRRRFPDILQENCASGGRRLDIEMATRAHAYCRSDYFIGQKPNDTAFILGQNATLNTVPYLPFQGCEFNCVPINDDYAAFSIISTGTVITFSDFDGGILRREFSADETKWFQKIFATAARMKEFYTGDFYPLCDETPATDDVWCGWQFDRPDLNAGFALVFRRGHATEESKTFSLGHIEPNADYEVEYFDGSRAPLSGNDLNQLKVTLPPRSFQLIFYKKCN